MERLEPRPSFQTWSHAAEAERVVRFARRRRHHRKGTWIVFGGGSSSRMLQVVYTIDPDGTIYIIHSMPV